MTWLDKLQRKFGRIGIPNLMLYIVVGNLLVFVFDLIFAAKGQTPFSSYINFVPQLIFQGQVWRAITFIFVPPNSSLVFIALTLYFYYFVGSNLENAWGTFRFTFYYLVGMIGIIIAGFCTGIALPGYLNLSLFLAFATLFPNVQVLLFFIIPVKVKYLGFADAVLFILAIIFQPIPYKVAALVSIVNYLIFFGPTFFGWLGAKRRQNRIRKEFQAKMDGTWKK